MPAISGVQACSQALYILVRSGAAATAATAATTTTYLNQGHCIVVLVGVFGRRVFRHPVDLLFAALL